MEYPTFSQKYLINKLYWYIPAGILLAIVLWIFDSEKVKKIMNKYDEDDDFCSFSNLLLFLLMFVVPIFLVVKF